MSAIVVECPKEYYGVLRHKWPSLFLAGGITGCEDWQKRAIEGLSKENIIIYNPRRAEWDMEDPTATEVQICWEFDKLSRSDIVSFWFSPETVQPIVLYELGMWGNGMSGRPIVIGVDENYKRKLDVFYQTALARPEITITTSFEEFLSSIRYMVRVITGQPTDPSSHAYRQRIERKISEK